MQSKSILWLLVFVLLANCIYAVDSKEVLIKKIKFLKMASSTYPFLNSYDFQTAPVTLGKFFTDPIYQKLQGNDLMGFTFNPGFTFSGNAIKLKSVKAPGSSEKYQKYLLNALTEVSKELGFSVNNNATCEMGLCMVTVMDRVTPETLAGVLLEVYVKNLGTKKTMFLRIKGGSKSGWYEGMKNAWRYIYLILKSTEKNGK